MTAPLKIAVAGLGVVGAETVRLIAAQAEMLAQRGGRPIVVTAVSARDRSKYRGLDLGSIAWFDDSVAMAREADADVICELIGGSEGIAKDACETAIAAGRHVVTANKALIAMHGAGLGRAAETAGVTLAYEAAVAGGIPIVKALREGLAANRITALAGVLNGTSNYILTRMQAAGLGFAAALTEEASAAGSARRPPAGADRFR